MSLDLVEFPRQDAWPKAVPNRADAELLARVRRCVSDLMGINVRYVDADSIIQRYEELMLEKAAYGLQRGGFMTDVAGKKITIAKLDLAYTVILGNRPGQRIGIVKMGESGYYPADGYDSANDTIEQVKVRVEELNARIGVPADVALSASIGSMFGWNVPGAQAAVRFFAAQQ